MPIIKSISSLRNHAREISAMCHKEDEPVFLTTNGESDLVVMSMEYYEKLKAQLELFENLAVAQAQSASGEKGISHAQMMQSLKQRIHAKQV
jgi:PHD/YefM family antitoxin component YafN of YafNO toxin-antitoxin module